MRGNMGTKKNKKGMRGMRYNQDRSNADPLRIMTNNNKNNNARMGKRGMRKNSRSKGSNSSNSRSKGSRMMMTFKGMKGMRPTGGRDTFFLGGRLPDSRFAPKRRQFQDPFGSDTMIEDGTNVNRDTDDIVYDPFTLTGVACPFKETPFASSMGIVFVGGNNGQALTPTEVTLLEEGMITTYNDLTFQSCDGYFRTLSSVQLVKQRFAVDPMDGSFPTIENTNTEASATAPLLFEGPYFATQGTCRGCPITESSTYPLFSSTSQRQRSLSIQQHSRENEEGIIIDTAATTISSNLRFLQEENDVLDICTCAKSASLNANDIPAPEAPTIDEFVQAYNALIQVYVNEGLLQTITGVALLEEYNDSVQVFCRGFDERLQLARVQVGFQGSPDALEADEIALLEMKFLEVYNELGYLMCDRYFRYVTVISLLEDGTFEVGYTCRGCPDNNLGRRTTLFMTEPGPLIPQRQRRTLETSMEVGTLGGVSSSGRQLQEMGDSSHLLRTCLCPEGPDYSNFEPNAPSADEFLTAYAAQINMLIAGGSIRNIQGITSVVESV